MICASVPEIRIESNADSDVGGVVFLKGSDVALSAAWGGSLTSLSTVGFRG